VLLGGQFLVRAEIENLALPKIMMLHDVIMDVLLLEELMGLSPPPRFPT
jgi:hypothetical protein